MNQKVYKQAYLNELQEELQALFEVLQYDAEEIAVEQSHAFFELLEALVSSPHVVDFTETMQAQIRECIVVYKQKQLEQWVHKQTELDTLQAKHQQAIEALECQLEIYQQENTAYRGRFEQMEQSQLATIEGLIALADTLTNRHAVFTQPSESSIPTDYQKIGAETMGWTAHAVEEALASLGVETRNVTGMLADGSQRIIGTTPTANPDMINIIAETARAGYVYQGNLIRAQEVVIYTMPQG